MQTEFEVQDILFDFKIISRRGEVYIFTALYYFRELMNNLMKTNLGRLRMIGIAEGISYLLLLGICMPLKYVFGFPNPTFFVGLAHGILFVLYCLWVLIVAYELKWSIVVIFWALLASLLPFGPFVADKRIFSVQP